MKMLSSVVLHVKASLIVKYFETPSASVARFISHDPLGGSFNALPWERRCFRRLMENGGNIINNIYLSSLFKF